MACGFRPYQLDQPRLLPEDLRAWLPEGHLALFLAEVVAQLDLGPILRTYTGGRGPWGYHPQMLLTVGTTHYTQFQASAAVQTLR